MSSPLAQIWSPPICQRKEEARAEAPSGIWQRSGATTWIMARCKMSAEACRD